MIHKVIDNLYIYYHNYYCNDESAGQSLQVNIDDYIVNDVFLIVQLHIICQWFDC